MLRPACRGLWVRPGVDALESKYDGRFSREHVCRGAAQQLAEQLQGVYLLDKKASETVRAGVLEALGLLVEVAPQVRPATWHRLDLTTPQSNCPAQRAHIQMRYALKAQLCLLSPLLCSSEALFLQSTSPFD